MATFVSLEVGNVSVQKLFRNGIVRLFFHLFFDDVELIISP